MKKKLHAIEIQRAINKILVIFLMKKISAINVKINFDKKERKKQQQKTTLNAPPTISLQLICHVFIHYIGQ